MQSLSSQLKQTILQFCSHKTLASLAQTSTAYQIEAEHALYHTLILRYPDNEACLYTLAMNPEKAAYVYVLQVFAQPYLFQVGEKPLMYYLVNALINMDSLYDFRLVRSNPSSDYVMEMDDILCRGHFRLQTLYCYNALNVSRILKSQPGLQVLGVHNCGYPTDLLETLKQFDRDNAQLFLPVIFKMDYITNYFPNPPAFHEITIFPAFYSADRITTIRQVLAESLEKHQNLDAVVDLCICLIDCSEMHIIHALAKDMAAIFPQIKRLHFSFERRCEIPLQKMKEAVSYFTNLTRLIMNLWHPHGSQSQTKEERVLSNLRKWRGTCPQLTEVFVRCLPKREV